MPDRHETVVTTAGTTQIKMFHHLIGGDEWDSGRSLFVDKHNPVTGTVDAMLALARREEVYRAVCAARDASGNSAFCQHDVETIGNCLDNFANLLRKTRDQLASQLFMDLGLHRQRCEQEIELACRILKSFSQNLACSLCHYAEPRPDDSHGLSLGCPLSGAVLSWQQPILDYICQIIPLFVKGASVIIVPSSYIPRVTLLLAMLSIQAGWESSRINIVYGDDETARLLADRPELSSFSFTGPAEQARIAFSYCGQHLIDATYFSDWQPNAMILPHSGDSGLSQWLQDWIHTDWTQFAGCSRYSTPIIFVDRQDMPGVIRTLRELAQTIKPVVPNRPDKNQIIPFPAEEYSQRCECAVHQSENFGARLVYGGVPFNPKGHSLSYCFTPTILEYESFPDNLPKDWATPGPILSIIPYQDEAQLAEFYRQRMPSHFFLYLPDRAVDIHTFPLSRFSHHGKLFRLDLTQKSIFSLPTTYFTPNVWCRTRY